jgi:hypothetical protein
LFALSRMVDVVLYNQARVHNLWPILLDHVVELLSDSKAAVRAAAVDALGRALMGALAGCVPAAAQVTSVRLPKMSRAGSGHVQGMKMDKL